MLSFYLSDQTKVELKTQLKKFLTINAKADIPTGEWERERAKERQREKEIEIDRERERGRDRERGGT